MAASSDIVSEAVDYHARGVSLESELERRGVLSVPEGFRVLEDVYSLTFPWQVERLEEDGSWTLYRSIFPTRLEALAYAHRLAGP